MPVVDWKAAHQVAIFVPPVLAVLVCRRDRSHLPLAMYVALCLRYFVGRSARVAVFGWLATCAVFVAAWSVFATTDVVNAACAERAAAASA